MKRIVCTMCVMGVVASLSCKAEPAPPLPANPSSAAQVAKQDASLTASKSSPRVDVDAVGDLVAEWERSQDEGDFEAYSTLYADRFTGVKRVGFRTTTFDRAGWLEDRGRMFRKPHEVDVSDLTVTPAGPTAVARFTQRWSSKNYADVGPKVLVLEATDQGLRIIREELLRSDVLAASEKAFDPNRGAPVLYDEYLVLSDRVEDAWKTKTHRLLGGKPTIMGGVAVSETWVDETKLPTSFQQLEGRTFHAPDASCEATVQGFRVLSRVTPHFGVVQDWEGRQGDKSTLHDIAREITELGGADGHVLVARLHQKCAGTTWMQSLDAASDQTFSHQALALEDDVLKVVAQTPIWGELTKEAESYGRQIWYSPEDVNVTRFATQADSFVSVSIRSGTGCGDFYGEFSALLRESPGGLQVVATNADGPWFDLKSAFLRDGEVLFLTTDALWRVSKGLERVITWEAPYLDCPC